MEPREIDCTVCGAKRRLYSPCPECGYPTFRVRENES